MKKKSKKINFIEKFPKPVQTIIQKLIKFRSVRSFKFFSPKLPFQMLFDLLGLILIFVILFTFLNYSGTLMREVQPAMDFLAQRQQINEVDSITQSACKSALINKKENDNWGDEDIKSTAQAILALNHIGENVEAPLDWLLSKRKMTEDLNWFFNYTNKV